jgi:hypothetical protein
MSKSPRPLSLTFHSPPYLSHDGLARALYSFLIFLGLSHGGLSRTDTLSVSDTFLLHHRISLPDVPEDVEDEVMLHFSDPDWGYQANSSGVSISTDSVECHP